MKRIMHLHLYCGEPLSWEPPKSLEQIEHDRRRVQEMLAKIEMAHLFQPGKDSYHLKLEICSKKFHILMEELQKDPHLASSWNRVECVYTDQELSSAPLLEWGPTNQAIEDDYYTLHFYKEELPKGISFYTRDCEVCRAPLEQIRDMWVDTRRMGKRDLSLTYGFEVIFSARLAQRLQEAGFTGFTLRPVWDYRKPYQGEPKLYQLVVTNILPPMASPPTEFEQAQHCEVCGTKTQYLKHTHFWGRIQYYEETDIYYAREVLEQAADFNATYERIGGLPDGHPLVLISQRVYRWLKEQRIKGWSARPVYLVESGTLTSE